MNINLIGLTPTELEKIIISIDEKKFRSKQLFNWFYKKNILDINSMTNIPEELKSKLLSNYLIKIPEICDVNISGDNSYKFLLKTYDEKIIESIIMPVKNRLTLCVSCMIGCPLKCKFCATGSSLKFIRNLKTSEIIGQVIATQTYMKRKVTNVVFMGMGEPLLNLENIQKSLEILLDKNGFGLSRNKITISTAGIVQNLSNTINRYRIKLAVSLHFPTNEQRQKFMPINKKIEIQKLIEELKKIKLAKQDYITIEYLMLDKINDTLEHAKKLIRLLNPLKTKINLIPYNPTETLKCNPSDENQINLFAKYLRSKGVMVTVRRSRGKNIKGGCGQFVLNKSKGEKNEFPLS